MKATRCLLVAVALLALSACGASGTGPRGVGQELVGTWTELTSVTGSFLEFTAIVSGTTVTGAGSYGMEGGPSGNLTVTGVIAGTEIQLQLAQDNGTVDHLNATFASPDTLTGSLFTTGDPVPVTFRRVPRE